VVAKKLDLWFNHHSNFQFQSNNSI